MRFLDQRPGSAIEATKVHPDLRRIVALYRLAGRACVGAGLLLMLLALLSRVHLAGGGWHVSAIVLVLFPAGVVLVALGGLTFCTGPRWFQRASWILWHTPPTAMLVEVRGERWMGEEDVTYYADLRPLGASGAEPPVESVRLLSAPLHSALIVQAPAEVYRDPAPGGPTVVRTDYGILWPLAAGRRREQRLGTALLAGHRPISLP